MRRLFGPSVVTALVLEAGGLAAKTRIEGIEKDPHIDTNVDAARREACAAKTVVSLRLRSMMRRREWIWVAGAAMLTAQSARKPELLTISQQPEHYHGWPTVTARRSGELLLVYSGGREAH